MGKMRMACIEQRDIEDKNHWKKNQGTAIKQMKIMLTLPQNAT